MMLWESLQRWIEYVQQHALGWGLRLVAALLILIVTRILANRLGRAIERLLSGGRMTQQMVHVITRGGRLAIVIMGLLAVLLALDLGQVVASFLAGLGITGLIVGFALQDITKNLAAGLLLLFQQPFRLGETIRVREFEGVVTDIALRATTIRTDDGRDVLIPNADIYTSVIVHLKRQASRRQSLSLTLAHDTPLGEALPQLQATTQAHPAVLETPPPQAVVTGISGTIAVEVRFWLPVREVDAAETISQVAKDLQALSIQRGWHQTA